MEFVRVANYDLSGFADTSAVTPGAESRKTPMSETFWQRLDKAARSITPFGLTRFLVILSVVPMRIPKYAEIAPVFSQQWQFTIGRLQSRISCRYGLYLCLAYSRTYCRCTSWTLYFSFFDCLWGGSLSTPILCEAFIPPLMARL